MSFAKIPPFLLTVFFTDQKFLILMTSRLSFISFTYHAFAVVSEKFATDPRSSGFSPVSSSGRFVDSPFTLRSGIPFALAFVKSVRSVSGFILHECAGTSRYSASFIDETVY